MVFALSLATPLAAPGSVVSTLRHCAPGVAPLEAARLLRLEIIRASQIYQEKTHTVLSKLSNLDSLTPEIQTQWDPLSSDDDEIISLGSGPDIFRPLYNFPFARHLHLVDVLKDWAPFRHPGVTFEELERRLHHLGPNAQVTLIKKGFLKYRLPPRVGFDEPWRFGEGADEVGSFSDIFRKPCTWKVEWDSVVAGHQERYVSLHINDYTMEETAHWVLNDIAGKNLGALFVTGAFLPDVEILAHYLAAVEDGGVVIAEMDYLSLTGDSGGDDSFFREVIYSSGFSPGEILPRNDFMMRMLPTRRIPRVYRFQKALEF